jgi:hypothetical protein
VANDPSPCAKVGPTSSCFTLRMHGFVSHVLLVLVIIVMAGISLVLEVGKMTYLGFIDLTFTYGFYVMMRYESKMSMGTTSCPNTVDQDNWMVWL